MSADPALLPVDLQRQNQFLQTLLDSVPVPAILNGLGDVIVEYVDLDMKIIWTNVNMAEAFDTPLEDLIGRHCYEVVQKRTTPCPGCSAVKVLETGQQQMGEVATPDGRFFLVHSNPVRDAAGRIAGIVHAAINITERKKMEDTLRESEDRYRTLVESADIAIATVSPDGTVLFANSTAARVFGIDVKAFPGHSVRDLYAEPEAEVRLRMIRDVASSGRGIVVKDWVRIRGQDRFFRTSVQPLADRDGSVLSVLIIGQDLTEVKTAELELKKQRDFNEAVLNAANALVVVLDRCGHIVRFNQSCERISGYTQEELVGTPCWDRLLVSDSAEQVQAIFQSIDSAPIPPEIETHIRTKQGHQGVVCWSNAPLLDEQGAVEYVVAIGQDVTEQRQAEQQLLESGRHIELVNQQLQHALTRANEMAIAAQQASRAKSAFLANMSHEIRTPLSAMLGYAELLGDSPALSPADRDHLSVMRRNGQHLLGLINDVLDLSKIEAGNLRLDNTRVSTTTMMADVTAMMRGQALKKGLDLAVEYRGEIPESILTDEERLRQVLINLVGNAVKFTEQGGVKVRVSYLRQWEDSRGALRVEVRDTGVGIAPEHLARLGDPFYQADGSATRRYGGTGLGLAICRRLIDAMGGRMDFESAAGRGSTFTVTIPAGPADQLRMIRGEQEFLAPGVPEKGASVAPGSLAGARLLLAEDGPDNQRLFKHILEGVGAVVQIAGTGRQAVDLAASTPFDLVLMDIQMPEMDGYEATRRLRESGFAAPIVALTAHAMQSERRRCIAAGCDGHLSKPIDRAHLIQAVAEHLSGLAGTRNAAPAGSGQPDDESAIVSTLDDPELASLIGPFVAGLPERFDAMRHALQASCWQDLGRLAHQLKGAGGGYGFADVTTVSAALEQAAGRADVEGASLALNDLQSLCRRMIRGLPAQCRRAGA